MRRCNSEKQRSFAGTNKTCSMMQYHLLQLKLFGSRLSDQSKLMFGHFEMRFVLNSLNLAIALHFANHSKKIDDRTRLRSIVVLRRL